MTLNKETKFVYVGLLLSLALAMLLVNRPVSATQSNEPEAPNNSSLDWEPVEPGRLISTNAATGASGPQMAISPDETELIMVYEQWVTGRDNRDPYFVTSANNGSNWTSPLPIYTSPSAIDSFGVDVTIDSQGTAHAVWVEFDVDGATNLVDIFYARRPSGGSWTAAVSISNLGSIDPSPFPLMVGPRITQSSTNTLDVVWAEADQNTINPTTDIYHRRSTNGGVTWTSKKLVTPAMTAPSSFEPDVTVDGSGTVHIAWEESAGGVDSDVHYVQGDGSGTWSTPLDLNAIDPEIVKARRPRITQNEDGILVSFTYFIDNDDSTTQFAYAVRCVTNCTNITNWTLTNASGQGLDVNTSDPFNLATAVAANDDTMFIYFHGTDPTETTEREQIWGVNECDGWSGNGRDVVTSPSIRGVFPAIAATNEFAHLAYEWANLGAGQNDHQIYYFRAAFDCSARILLPTIISQD